MNTNLYVGNLAFHTTAADLTEAFSHFGTVISSLIVTNPDSSESRGYGYVEMSEGSEQAIAGMNGTQLQGSTLTVKEVDPHEDRLRPDGDAPPNEQVSWGSNTNDSPAFRDADAYEPAHNEKSYAGPDGYGLKMD